MKKKIKAEQIFQTELIVFMMIKRISTNLQSYIVIYNVDSGDDRTWESDCDLSF